MELQTLIQIVEHFKNTIIIDNKIEDIINQFMKQRNAFQNNPREHILKFADSIRSIKTKFAFLTVLNSTEKTLMKIWGKEDLLRTEFYDDTISLINSQPHISVNTMATFLQKVQDFCQIISSQYNLLEQYKVFNIRESEGKSMFEIVFQENVEINNMHEGKDQFNNWWHIIGGYAQMLNLRSEDFEIVSITKNSPTKIKIEVVSAAAVAILSITAELVKLENTYITNRMQLEQLKVNSLVKGEIHEKYIKEAEKELDERIEKKLTDIVEKNIHKHNANIESTSSINKSIKNQYTFIVKGGDVKFYINEESSGNKILEIEEMKTKTKTIQDTLQSIIMIGRDSSSQSE
jgi:hypothetical protein